MREHSVLMCWLKSIARIRNECHVITDEQRNIRVAQKSKPLPSDKKSH